ncbi:YdjC-like protein [compost metagenome]
MRAANKKGILLLDYIEMLPFSMPDGLTPDYKMTKDAAVSIIRQLKPGVTELVLHPSLDTDELKAITDTSQIRQYDYDVFRDEEIRALLKSEEVRMIGWRDIQAMQRA